VIRGLLADANADGYLAALVRICSSPAWNTFWRALHVSTFTFIDFELQPNTADSVLWHFCQDQRFILLAANRNSDRPDSLEATIRAHGQGSSLPVITIADAFQLMRHREYCERAAVRLLEILHEIDEFCGSGRLYIPARPAT